MNERNFYEVMDLIATVARAFFIMDGSDSDERTKNYINQYADYAIQQLSMLDCDGDAPATESLRQATIAMLCEELCAKRKRNITEYFQRLARLVFVKGNEPFSDVDLAICKIARAVCHNDILETHKLFDALTTMSAEIVDEYGVYEGGC